MECVLFMKKIMKKAILIAVILLGLPGLGLTAEIMQASALASFPNPPADHVIAYGEDELQFGELRLPSGPGPFPLSVLIHG